MNTRVRFAPSPTGPLHIGGLRTALFNYLFAKKKGGTFVLRMEDTDQNRYVEGSEDYIQEALEWCGMSPDEGPKNKGKYGPYRQSERKSIYAKHIQTLLKNGAAYYAFDKTEQLNEERKEAEKKGQTFKYSNHNRLRFKNSLTLTEKETAEALKKDFVIRLRVEPDKTVIVKDIIRGVVRVETNSLDDKILMKSDGMPTYHFANVVDDHLMKITCVIRGEEWLPSAPLHVTLYKFLGWEETMPKFAHLPLILRPDGNGKLSKRDGDRLGFPVFPLNWTDPESGELSSGYREAGYYPQAFVNMLAFLGWNPGTYQELFSLEELAEAFSLERVGKAGAKFDADKTRWFNQQYLRHTPSSEIAERLLADAQSHGFGGDVDTLARVVELMKERATFEKEILEEGKYFFEQPTAYDEKIVAKRWKEETPQHLKNLQEQFNGTDFSAEALEAVFKGYLEANGLGFGALGQPLRVAITGLGAGPSLFEIIAILGKEEVNSRMNKAFEVLG